MTRRILTLTGDSLPTGTGPSGTASTYEQGGKGSFWERTRDALGNLATIGPLLSAGMRMTSLGYVPANLTEWTFQGSHTAVTSTDAFDKVPYGGSGIQGFRWGNGSGVIDTWTKQRWMPPVLGVEVDIIDMAGGGEFQYRIDGGTWTSINQGANLLANNTWLRFRIATAISSTIDFRAYNGTTGVNMLMVAVEPLFSLAANGFIFHNIGINGSKLHELTATTSGDRLAVFGTIRLGTGSPVAPTPNVGVINMSLNDVLLASSSGYGTDLDTLNTKVTGYGPIGIVNPWEAATGTYNQTQQTNYRAQAKTSAAAWSVPGKVLDLYDLWSANGFAANAGAVAAGFLAADAIHEATAGHTDIWPRLYWFVRNQFLSAGNVPSSYPVAGKRPAVQYSGKRAAVQYSAGAPISV